MMSPIDDRNCRPIVSDDSTHSETWQGNVGKVTNMFTLTCSFLIAIHCFEDAYMGISHCLRKIIMQSTGKKNSRKAWVDALAAVI